jgi:hypothetical protein
MQKSNILALNQNMKAGSIPVIHIIWKIYEAQKMKCNRGDWFEIINIERKDNDVIQSCEEIACMSREKFKTLIDKKVEASAM